MHPCMVVQGLQGVGDAPHARGSGAGEHRGQGSMCAEAVLRPVVGTAEPVEAPHVLPPADQLADETLRAGDRHVPGAVGGLRRCHHLGGSQQADVEVLRQQAVTHVPARRRHRVLVRAEARQHALHEVVEAPQRSVARGGPGAVRLGAPCVRTHALQHLDVDGVQRVAQWLRPVVHAVLRRWFAVLGVEVPTTPGRLVAIHQHAQPTALPAVEVLHPQLASALRPLGELIGVAQELVGPHQGDTQPSQQIRAVDAGRLGGHHLDGCELGDMGAEAVGQRLGPAHVDQPTGRA